jgi:hypothetical protein
MFKRLARSRPRDLPHAPEQSRHDAETKPQPESRREAERDAEAPPRSERHWLIRDLAGFEFPYEP